MFGIGRDLRPLVWAVWSGIGLLLGGGLAMFIAVPQEKPALPPRPPIAPPPQRSQSEDSSTDQKSVDEDTSDGSSKASSPDSRDSEPTASAQSSPERTSRNRSGASSSPTLAFAAAPAAAASLSDADFAQHIEKLKARLPHAGFHIVIQKPFVVIGDESPETVQRRSVQTVKWAVDRLKKDYFERDPDHVIDVWLFKDKASYERHALQLFDDRPSTPYGYYSSEHRALVMNIATGGGTLVHEIVHPFMAANFKKCPSWFNEGLASLYEQSSEREGHIIGLTNWRLSGLQKAIGAQRVPPFQTLCSTTRREFYNEDPGTNYSQARYLCYYLQEQGLLKKYFHEFRKSADEDPSGYATLMRVLKERDMNAFQTKWEQEVLKLRF